jgi:hypothetical protein
MFYMCVELTNMVQQLKSKLFSRRKPLRRSVITIIKFTKMFISGSILDLTILEEQVLNGMLKSVNKFSSILIKMER